MIRRIIWLSVFLALLSVAGVIGYRQRPWFGLGSAVITLDRTPCYGWCPDYKVTIRGDGDVLYDGRTFVSTLGQRHRQIARDRVRSLIREIWASDFFELAELYRMWQPPLDASSTIISVKVGRTSGTARCDPNRGPRTLRRIARRIEDVAMTEAWVGLNDDQRVWDYLQSVQGKP